VGQVSGGTDVFNSRQLGDSIARQFWRPVVGLRARYARPTAILVGGRAGERHGARTAHNKWMAMYKRRRTILLISYVAVGEDNSAEAAADWF